MIRGGAGKLKGRRNRRGTTINREVVRRWRKPLTRFIYENEDKLPGLKMLLPNMGYVFTQTKPMLLRWNAAEDPTNWNVR